MEIRQLIQDLLGQEADDLLSGRILVVDDEEGNVVVLEDLLMDDYEVDTAMSAEEALQHLETKEYDMVLSDQRMPGITGTELLAAVHEKYPDTVRIIISAFSDSSEMLDAINQGQVYRYVLKPWDPMDLEAVVQQGMQHRFQVLAIRHLVEALSNRNSQLEDALKQIKDTQSQLLHSAKLASIGQLTASITHELRNQIGGIMTAYEMMRLKGVPEDLAECIEVGARSAQSLAELVSSINSYARRGSDTLMMIPTTMSLILKDVSRILRTDKRVKDRIVTFPGPEDDCIVVVDNSKLRQVLINLIRNSLDATVSGDSIQISQSQAPRTVILTISDSGMGIPPENLARIFQPFFTTKENGLGLGLDICRQIVEAHGGSLRIESELGRGTRVIISLPCPEL